MSECRKWTEEEFYLKDAMEKWESDIKRNFNGKNKTCLIPCRGIGNNASLNIEKGDLKVSCDTIKKVFSTVIEKILKLVKGQIKEVQKQTDKTKTEGHEEAKINAILLAGGFGRNEYLKESIQEAVGKNVKVKRMEDG